MASFLNKYRFKTPLDNKAFKLALEELNDLITLQQTLINQPSLENDSDLLKITIIAMSRRYGWSLESHDEIKKDLIDSKQSLYNALQSRTDSLFQKISDFFRNIGWKKTAKYEDFKKMVDRVDGLNELERPTFTENFNKQTGNNVTMNPKDKSMIQIAPLTEEFKRVTQLYLKKVDEIYDTFKDYNTRTIVDYKKALRDVVGKVPKDLNFEKFPMFDFDVTDPTESRYDVCLSFHSFKDNFKTDYDTVAKTLKENAKDLDNNVNRNSKDETKVYKNLSRLLDLIVREYNPNTTNAEERKFFLGLYNYGLLLTNAYREADWIRYDACIATFFPCHRAINNKVG